MINPVPKPKRRRLKPTRRRRNEFSRELRQEILLERDGVCQQCGGIGTEIHHVMPRARSGRGVKTNALLVCASCHRQIHQQPDLLQEWIKHYRSMYGDDFYMDEWDGE